MNTERVVRGGQPRTQGREDDPLVTVNLHVRQSQLAALDRLADAERMSRAALVRQAVDRLLQSLRISTQTLEPLVSDAKSQSTEEKEEEAC
jgi:hypothetical protein